MYRAPLTVADGQADAHTMSDHGGASASGGVHTPAPASVADDGNASATHDDMSLYDPVGSAAALWDSPPRGAASVQWLHSLDAGDDGSSWAAAGSGSWLADGVGASPVAPRAPPHPGTPRGGHQAVGTSIAQPGTHSQSHTSVATTYAPYNAATHTTAASAGAGATSAPRAAAASVSTAAYTSPHAWSDAELVAAAIQEAQEETERLARAAAAVPVVSGAGSSGHGAMAFGPPTAHTPAGNDIHAAGPSQYQAGGATAVGAFSGRTAVDGVGAAPESGATQAPAAAPDGYAGPHSLQEFWDGVHADIETNGVTKPQLPLNRIKKIMKSDDHITEMISSETKACFAKACHIFIAELAWRAWQLVRKNGRNTLLLNDVSGAISNDEMYDFLIDIAPQPIVKSVGERPHEQVQRMWFLQQLEAQRLEREAALQHYHDGGQGRAALHLRPPGTQQQPHDLVHTPGQAGHGVGADAAGPTPPPAHHDQRRPAHGEPEIVYPRYAQPRKRRRDEPPAAATAHTPAVHHPAPAPTTPRQPVFHQPQASHGALSSQRQVAVSATAAPAMAPTARHSAAGAGGPVASVAAPANHTPHMVSGHHWAASGGGASASGVAAHTHASAGAAPHTHVGRGLSINTGEGAMSQRAANGYATGVMYVHPVANMSGGVNSNGTSHGTALHNGLPGPPVGSPSSFSAQPVHHFSQGYGMADGDLALVPGPTGGPQRAHRAEHGHEYSLPTPTGGQSTPTSTTRRFV